MKEKPDVYLCKSPYCECEPGKCSQSGFIDARALAAKELQQKRKP